MRKPDVIIVGGGVIGCAAAYYLAQKKVNVLVLEKDEIGKGGSSRNGGGVRQSARDPRELPLAMYAVQNLWPTLSEELGENVEYHKEGNLRLGKNEAHKKILENLVSQGVKQGLDQRLIDYKEARTICPYMSEEVMVASWCPTDGHANPMKTTLAFYKRALEQGATFITGEDVLSLMERQGRVVGVRTAENTYEAGSVLVAAGFFSRKLLQSVGIDMPMYNVVDEALITEALPPMFGQMLGTAAADFYGHQTEHGSFVFGGSTGLEQFISSDMTAPDTHSVTAPYLCRSILGYFPRLAGVNIIRTWAGFIDKMADGVPVISQVDELPGLYAACGFSGHGFGISPIVGLLLSELIADGAPRLSLDALRYDRFKPKG